MSHSSLTEWIESADAREISRGAVFLMDAQGKQHLHLGATIAKVAEWWHHNITNDVLPVHYEPHTCH